MHVFIINLTSDKLDNSFTLVADMKGASVTFGWKDGAPASISNPNNSILIQKVAIPAITNLLAETLSGFSPEQIMSLEFVVIGGNEEIKHWIAYITGRWNIALTFWHERSRNVWASEQVKPGDDPILPIFK